MEWLSDVEQQAWRGWIDASRRIHAATERQLKGDHNLSADDYEVLVRLSETTEGRLRMSDLAVSVANSPSRFSQRVDRMERRDLIRRVRCDEDGRVWWVELTGPGRDALSDAAPGHVAEVRRQFIGRLSADEIAFLAAVMPKLQLREEN